jgi:hypothetical protein
MIDAGMKINLRRCPNPALLRAFHPSFHQIYPHPVKPFGLEFFGYF